MFLLDTNVVSELRKIGSGRADPQVTKWNESAVAANQFVSVITILELLTGVLRLERRDAVQGTVLRAWLESAVIPGFQGRILPIDLPVATVCANLHVPDPRPAQDALIAATALVHGLTLITRNTSDFQGTGVRLVNPWEAAEV